jgi:hypothetical protein
LPEADQFPDRSSKKEVGAAIAVEMEMAPVSAIAKQNRFMKLP